MALGAAALPAASQQAGQTVDVARPDWSVIPRDFDPSKVPILDRTFLPESWIKPIFLELMQGAQMVHRPNWIHRRECDRLIGDVLAWRDVELLQPDFVANRYDDPSFAPIIAACPRMRPHGTLDWAGVYDPDVHGEWSGKSLFWQTHNFRWYTVSREKRQHLLFSQGHATDAEIDWRGRPRMPGAGIDYTRNGGRLVAIDLNKCSVQQPGQPSNADRLWYLFGESSGLLDISFVIQKGERTYAVRVRYFDGTEQKTLTIDDIHPLLFDKTFLQVEENQEKMNESHKQYTELRRQRPLLCSADLRVPRARTFEQVRR